MPSCYGLLPPSRERLDELRESARDHSITYQGVGGSLTGDHVEGFHWHESELTVTADWDSAREAIRQWAGHRSVGGVLNPEVPPLTAGSTVAFGIPVLGIWASGTCRIVSVFDGERDFGFAYGTLPHHPEQGEEVFAVRDNADGTVTFRVAAFSKPADLITRLIGPLGRVIQRWMARRYLRGFATFASRSDVAAVR